MPSVSDFFWLNQQGQKAFDDTSDGYIQLDGYYAGSSELNLLLQAIPHFPFTATAHIHSLTPTPSDGYQKERYGMVLRQDNGTLATGQNRILSFSLTLDGYHDGYQVPAFHISKHINELSVPGSDYISIFNDGYNIAEWLQIQDDGADLHFLFSNDGGTFTEIFKVDRKDFLLLGGTQVGFGGIGNIAVNNTAEFLLMDWTII